MSEQKLIRRCLKEDKKAWGIFIDKYSKLVYWAIQRCLGLSNFKSNQADIDDIFQEVFLSILKDRKLTQVKDPKSLSGWVARVASSRSIDFIRQKINCREDLVLDKIVFRNDTLEPDFFIRDSADLVKEIIDSLPDKERKIISLNLLEGKTHKEIAADLAIPLNTVSTIISRTKEKVKQALQNRGIDENF
ncbi:MAG: sigma-70 family RNA polymerase sigma factor [Candidatus Omnitrophica bacterium]|nr:sigma-70 family RNA polymerase sigma factor [Candidatus Omnitrophota bacterium]MBU2044745.1 sigma-70 family RNA polymerase sigma factor [Candidatus Omnitrophota bacterium]MBU2250883.1 sigma-70 family RNA polymerase sigma factor [Candidatus Omnitrophota bacterium]MBU2473888.1 sigma-70 family RNA polymerase sigma factor [Candidatus Omnitrophota bacterium]